MAGVRAASNLARLRALCPSVECQDCASTVDLPALLGRFGVDAIIHCAAYGVDYRQSDRDTAIDTNVRFSADLVVAAAAAHVQRFIHVGTCYEYGAQVGKITEDTLPSPRGIYGATKYAGFVVARERAEACSLAYVAVRPFGIYGPLEGVHKLVPTVMRAAKDARPLELTAGEQLRDYVYVTDVADACAKLLDRSAPLGATVLNLCTGIPLTLRRFVEAVADSCESPPALLWGARPYRPDENMSVVGNPGLAKELLNWTATTSLEDGLREVADYEHLRKDF